MAFGIKKEELAIWKSKVKMGEIAFLTHYWLDERFPSCFTVTKVGCSNIPKLRAWGKQYGLKETWIHYDDDYPHFDRSEEHTSELQSRFELVCRLLLQENKQAGL